MNFILGETRQVAMWFHKAKGKRFAKDVIKEAFKHDTENGVIFGPIEFEVVLPGDARLPEAPMRGLRCMLGSAKITEITPQTHREVASFTDDLSWIDHKRLREVCRQRHRELNPKKPDLTDAQCDRYIEMVGPQIHENEIKAAVDEGRVN